MGPKVEELEQLVAAACGVEHAVAVSNGTAALHLAVLALGIGAGDEVIVPAYTFPATANVVRLAGATPVLVDVDPATFNLDLGKVYDAVTPRTKAVLAVHLFGRPLDWEALQSAAPAGRAAARGRGGRARRPLARDALRRARVRSAASRSTRARSSRPGEGGAVTTNDAELAAAVRRLRHHGIGPDADIVAPFDELPARGHPLRGRDPAAAPARRAARRADADRCRLHRAPGGGRRRCRRPTRATRTAGRPTSSGSTGKDEALQELRAEGIEVQIGTYALHRLSAYREQGAFPGADAAFDRALALPLHSRLTDDELDRVAAGVARFA